MRQEYDFSEAERGRFFRANARLNLPVSEEKPDWALPDGRLGCFIVEEVERTLNAYREQPSLVTEAANQEHDTAHGGYAHRQLFELVQNSADALASFSHRGSILLRLTGSHLYCADDGRPIDEDGVKALMFSHMSPKRDTRRDRKVRIGIQVRSRGDGRDPSSSAVRGRFASTESARRLASGRCAPTRSVSRY